MIEETMTKEQRIDTAIACGLPDRVPVVPLIYQFASRHKGVKPIRSVSGGKLMENWREILEAFHSTFNELGGYDGLDQVGIGPSASNSTWRSSIGLPSVVSPGTNGIPEDFSMQYREKETLTTDDYDTIIARGWNGFCEEYFPRETGLSLNQIEAANTTGENVLLEETRRWKEESVPVLIGGSCFSPEMIVSLARTLPKFAFDVHKNPEKVKDVLEAMVPDIIQNVIADAKATGIPRAMLVSERASGAYWSLDKFERIFFPPIKKIVEALVEAGLTCQLHLDTNYTLNLPYLKELPKGRCICELDSTTDIFKAKEVLKGHMCIMGDVPASILSLGTIDDVIAYCTKLIDIVGKDGGFILSTGCECPVDAKFENVKAMIDTAKTYNPHG